MFFFFFFISLLSDIFPSYHFSSFFSITANFHNPFRSDLKHTSKQTEKSFFEGARNNLTGTYVHIFSNYNSRMHSRSFLRLSSSRVPGKRFHPGRTTSLIADFPRQDREDDRGRGIINRSPTKLARPSN